MANQIAQTSPNDPLFLFFGTDADRSYLPNLKSIVGTARINVVIGALSTWVELKMMAEKKGCAGIFSTSEWLLRRMTGNDKSSLEDYAGSYFCRDGIEIVFLFPLERMVTQRYIQTFQRRYVSKLLAPETWMEHRAFQYQLLDEGKAAAFLERARQPDVLLIAVDTETLEKPLCIRCIGYTLVITGADGSISTLSVCLPITSTVAAYWMQRINAETPAPKALQNGKYDWAYLHLYGAPLHNCLLDTQTLFHCLYSEAPKDLGFINAFCLRKSEFWKDKADTGNLSDLYEYCALDTWATALCALVLITQQPACARANYLAEFPLLFPCHLAEMTGVKRDMQALVTSHNAAQERIASKNRSLWRMIGCEGFNVGSPVQMKMLMQMLGEKDPESSDEKSLKRLAYAHPLNARILELVLEIREDRKLVSTYLGVDDAHAAEINGRILYSLNPHGTDSGRLASREHAFWNGLNIQNVPRGASVKSTIVADEGFVFGECDLKQAESRDTAYIAGDEGYIQAVTGTRDFHSVNASAFFGVPYQDIWSDELGKALNKALRDVAKRVNHGANYVMGPDVLVDTMGLQAIFEAGRLLSLPRWFTARNIAEELLTRFHRTYPVLRAKMYPAIIQEVVTTGRLVGATGWTRVCFGKPLAVKHDYNSYIAHVPQSLNAQKLNRAWMRVFYEIAMHPEHGQHFKLLAQIHDSIWFMFRIGHEYLCRMVADRMLVPVTVRGYGDRKVRTYTVPVDVKAGKDGKGAKYWHQCDE